MIRREFALLLERGQVAGTGTRAARALPGAWPYSAPAWPGLAVEPAAGERGTERHGEPRVRGQESGCRAAGRSGARRLLSCAPLRRPFWRRPGGSQRTVLPAPALRARGHRKDKPGGSQAPWASEEGFPWIVGASGAPSVSTLRGSCLPSSVCHAGSPFDSRATVHRHPGRALGSRVLHRADPRGRHRDSLPSTVALRSPSGGPNHTGAWAI